jgi:hypothetical protein
MTDKELLELAAKAAELPVEFEDGSTNDWWPCGRDNKGDIVDYWNPLLDDGDALRLAIALYSKGFMLDAGSGGVCITVGHPAIFADEWSHLDEPFDQYAATRRAIVRAAAEIGKAKQ